MSEETPKGFAELVCDARGCDYTEYVGTVSPEYIGKPCPKCGANLLTQEDYDAAMPTFALLEALRTLGLAKPVSEARGTGTIISVQHHAGEIRIRHRRHNGEESA
jgi:hypothetical protein